MSIKFSRYLKKAMPVATVMLLLIYSQSARAGTIFGSPHDFRGPPWKPSGEICLPCHVPHSTQTLPAPLWDLELSTDTYSVYGMNRSPAVNAKLSRQPDGMSKICVSCHDGIIASEVYGGHTGASAGGPGRGPMAGMPGSDHPISFVYDTALALKDKDLYDPATRPSGMAGSTATIAADLLFLKRMECASCHDVHNTKAVPGTKLLVKDTAGSALCLTCHNK
jgi:predicted CXXCH cytochrome family protein